MLPLIKITSESLPSNKKNAGKKTNHNRQLRLRPGKMDLFYEKEMDTPMAQIYDMIHGKMEYNLKNVLVMDALTAVLDQCYIASIREAERRGLQRSNKWRSTVPAEDEAYILVNFPKTRPTEAMNKLVYVELDNIIRMVLERSTLKKH